MAGKTRARYAGPLNEPISRRQREALGDLGGAERERILNALGEKILLLFDHYEIPREAADRWQRLAIHLAFDHVKGFKIDSSKRRGAPERWTYQECQDFVAAIDAHKNGRRTLRQRIAMAQKRAGWRWNRIGHPEIRYYEAKRKIVRRRVIQALASVPGTQLPPMMGGLYGLGGQRLAQESTENTNR